jgi:N-acetylglucosamine kinase-like BadF-type ATPase
MWTTKMSGGHYLGIDGGGTKTEAVVLDGAGNELARAAGGPSNVHSAGQTTTEASLRDVILQVLERAALTVNGVTAVGLGMAGVDRPGDREMVHDILTRIARFPNVIITNDAEAALVGGVGHRHGVVLIAGTGAFAYGVNARGETGRADGWGYLLGDEGSAYWIGAEGLRAIARAHDGRGPATELTEALLEHLELSDATHLVTRRRLGPPSLAPGRTEIKRRAKGRHHWIRHDE